MILCPGVVAGMPVVLQVISLAKCLCEMIFCPGIVAGMPVVLQVISLARCLCEMIFCPGIVADMPVVLQATCLAIFVGVVHAVPGKQTVDLGSFAPMPVVYFPSGSSLLPVVQVRGCSTFVVWPPVVQATCFVARRPVCRFQH